MLYFLLHTVQEGENGRTGEVRQQWVYTYDVKLRLALILGGMQRDDLRAQQVVARRDAGRYCGVDPASILDHVVYAPCPAVQAVFGDFEPF